jgi:hypothetical protein
MVIRGKMDQVRLRLISWYAIRHCPLQNSCSQTPSDPLGVVSPRVPPHFHLVGLVVRAQALPWGRRILWRAVEFVDSRHDVQLLHAQPAEDPMSMEEVPNAGPNTAVPIRPGVLGVQPLSHARGRELDAVPCVRDPGVRDVEHVCAVPALLFESLQQATADVIEASVVVGVVHGQRIGRGRRARIGLVRKL